MDAGYRASMNAVNGGFLEGTRTALFAELEKWIERGSSDKPVCILSGGAGKGKSTVASELARRLDDQEKLGASFFFARGVADLDSTRVFFPTIAYQLAHWTTGTLRQSIIDAARVHSKKGTSQAMKYEAPALLHTPLKSANKESPMFIVVDALDECTQEAFNKVPEMLDLLMAATQHGPLRIFLTSRPDQLVEYKLMESPQWSNIIHTISIDTFSDDASRDVATFVNVRLREMARGPELLRSRPEVGDHLARRAQDLFIYARTAMDFLETYPGTLEGAVDLLLSSEEGIALGALDQLYLTVLANAFPPAHMKSPTLRSHVQLVLACIALPNLNPMTPRILESLTSLTSTPITCKDMDSVSDRLRSVVVFKRGIPDERLRPMHATFPQFLTDPARCMDLYLVDPRRHHAYLAQACLITVLSLNENMCKLDLLALHEALQEWAEEWRQRREQLRKEIVAEDDDDTLARLFKQVRALEWTLDLAKERGWPMLECQRVLKDERVLEWALWRESNHFIRKLRLMLLPGDNPKHVRYACMSWAAHLREACTPEEHQGKDSECFCKNLVELLQRLIRDSDNLKRLEIVNLMEETGCSLRADLGYARNWLPSDVCIPFPTPFLSSP